MLEMIESVLFISQRLQLIIIENGESIQHHFRKGLSLQNITIPRLENVAEVANIIAGLEHGNDHDYGIESIRNDPFTNEEDNYIMTQVGLIGLKFSKIAKNLGRSTAQVKNRYEIIKKRAKITVSFN